MLVALERRKQRAMQAFRAITRLGIVPYVPAVVLVEWWRGRTDVRDEILDSVVVEDMAPLLCKAAGEALASVSGAQFADAALREKVAQALLAIQTNRAKEARTLELSARGQGKRTVRVAYKIGRAHV